MEWLEDADHKCNGRAALTREYAIRVTQPPGGPLSAHSATPHPPINVSGRLALHRALPAGRAMAFVAARIVSSEGMTRITAASDCRRTARSFRRSIRDARFGAVPRSGSQQTKCGRVVVCSCVLAFRKRGGFNRYFGIPLKAALRQAQGDAGWACLRVPLLAGRRILSQSPSIRAIFFVRDHPLSCFSAAIASPG